ncbi:uncharacterized protein LOC107647207 [Arachis ipaensis]|uniref:uncharacterized protein LOC107647207 n=1 Tax=Arachis ipaensis TaxID=130454 RepID=UPI000A2B6D23|nr:uncharacterized protein LOC107647207 [Arachis ipaensis]
MTSREPRLLRLLRSFSLLRGSLCRFVVTVLVSSPSSASSTLSDWLVVSVVCLPYSVGQVRKLQWRMTSSSSKAEDPWKWNVAIMDMFSQAETDYVDDGVCMIFSLIGQE